MPGNTYCCVADCTRNSKQQPDLVFFRVPRVRKRTEAWAKAIGREDILLKKDPSNSRVCAVHFEPSMFVNKRLNPTAVPSLFLPTKTGTATSEEEMDLLSSNPSDVGHTLLKLNASSTSKIQLDDESYELYLDTWSRRSNLESEEKVEIQLSNSDEQEDFSIQTFLNTSKLKPEPSTENYPQKKKDETQDSKEIAIKDPQVPQDSKLLSELVSRVKREIEEGSVIQTCIHSGAIVNPDFRTQDYKEEFIIKTKELDTNTTYTDKFQASQASTSGFGLDVNTNRNSESDNIMGIISDDITKPVILNGPKIKHIKHSTLRFIKSSDVSSPYIIVKSQQDLLGNKLTQSNFNVSKALSNKKRFVIKAADSTLTQNKDESPVLLLKKKDLSFTPQTIKILTTGVNTLKRKQENFESIDRTKITKVSSEKITASDLLSSNDDDDLECSKLNTLNKSKENRLKWRLIGFNLFISSSAQVYDYFKTKKDVKVDLPNMETVENIKIYFETGVSDDIIAMLVNKIKVNPPDFKYCMITIKEMDLKQKLDYEYKLDEMRGFVEIDGIKHNEIATSALVVSIKGCIREYNYPLGYAFTGVGKYFKNLLKWLLQTIAKLIRKGFVVCAVVTHQKYHFGDLAKTMSISDQAPYFNVYGKKIFYVFDVRHNIKDLYENLFQYDFLYENGKIASWKHIQAFYDKDKERLIKMAPKLTDLHLNPDLSAKENVTYGTQIFSHSVAAGMSIAVEMGHLPVEARETIDFVLKVNRLFDILYTDTDIICNLHQVEQLNDLLETFKTVKAVKINEETNEYVVRDVEVFFATQVTLNTILQLHDYFETNGVTSFSPKHLNLDATEKFIETIKMGTETSQPTAVQFKETFSKLVFEKMFSNPVELNDVIDLIPFFNDCVSKTKLLFKRQLLGKVAVLKFGLKERVSELSEKPFNQESIFDLCLRKHVCETIIKQKAKGLLTSPFAHYLLLLQEAFRKEYRNVALEKGIGQMLFERLEEKVTKFKEPCPCFSVKSFLKIFLIMRLTHIELLCQLPGIVKNRLESQNNRDRDKIKVIVRDFK